MKNLFWILSLFISLSTYAQDLKYARKIIETLCSSEYAGRGYVDDGVNKAAHFLAKEFKQIGLQPIGSSYFQEYTFSVNTHPFPIRCEIDEQEMRAGYDFIVAASSPRISGTFKLIHVNPHDSIENELLHLKLEKGFEKDEALVIHHANERNTHFTDSFSLYHTQPRLLIYTEDKKLTHTISTEVDAIPSLIFFDSLINNKDQIQIELTNDFIKSFPNKNIIGKIKGKKSNQTIVFTAHYDHLGALGTQAFFPGASDNASGVSMICYLAAYFKKHRPKHDIAFILFSGEEAGLIGSQVYTENPVFNLNNIHTLVNIDIMGNAENGITIVNGETFPKIFEALSTINTQKNYVPEIKIRGKAHNSDHYYFSEKGVPAIFIYSMGGPGYYHDVLDDAQSVQLTNYENVAQLLIDYVNTIK
ncbi:MAG: M28 family peptidase [Chitinophagaceae bacterium]